MCSALKEDLLWQLVGDEDEVGNSRGYSSANHCPVHTLQGTVILQVPFFDDFFGLCVCVCVCVCVYGF